MAKKPSVPHTPRKRSPAAAPKFTLDNLPPIEAPRAAHEVAFLVHLGPGYLAVPPKEWIEDPDSPEKVTTYDVSDEEPPCVEMDSHLVVRASLAYAGTLQAPQRQDDPSVKREWILVRRRL